MPTWTARLIACGSQSGVFVNLQSHLPITYCEYLKLPNCICSLLSYSLEINLANIKFRQFGWSETEPGIRCYAPFLPNNTIFKSSN